MSNQTPEQPHSKNSMWANYYDRWFELDHEVLKSIIDEGETSVVRALNRYQRIVHGQTKGGTFTPDGQFKDPTREDIDYSASPFILPTGKPMYTVGSMIGNKFPVPFYIDISVYAARYLMDVVAELAPQAIVELGAGDGSRLFELDGLGIDRSIALYAAEQSEHARNIVDTLSALDPGINISSHPFDFGKPDFSFLKERDNVLVFTHMTLMFLQDIEEEFVLSLAGAAKKVTCFHFEPFGHQFSTATSPASPEQGNFFREKGWNTTFMALLDRLQRQGRIKNLMVLKDVVYGGDILMPKCVVSWENV